jgi:hypothetical protein
MQKDLVKPGLRGILNVVTAAMQHARLTSGMGIISSANTSSRGARHEQKHF